MTETTTEPMSRTLEVPGAILTYDVRGNDAGTDPVLFMIASPMGAAGFGTLAAHFTDRTVVTYDPRGSERSTRTDGATQNTIEEHANDLHRLIAALDAGPVDLFASSGGAVNALALVAEHPEQVRTLIAHEPPLVAVLPDRERALAATRDMYETYQRSGLGAGMAKFIALTSHKGAIPADWLDRPAPDPAAFGLPTEDDGSRDDPLLGQTIGSTPCMSPTSMPSVRRRRASSWPPAASRPARWPTAAPSPWPSGSGRRRSPSPATTVDSSAASTAGRASPTPSPRSSARCWPGPERLAGGGRLVPLP